MTRDDKRFFQALGGRVAELRMDRKLTQQALADELGIAQQTLAHYEGGRLRMPMSLLPKLVKRLGVGADELLGIKTRSGRRNSSTA